MKVEKKATNKKAAAAKTPKPKKAAKKTTAEERATEQTPLPAELKPQIETHCEPKTTTMQATTPKVQPSEEDQAMRTMARHNLREIWMVGGVFFNRQDTAREYAIKNLLEVKHYQR